MTTVTVAQDAVIFTDLWKGDDIKNPDSHFGISAGPAIDNDIILPEDCFTSFILSARLIWSRSHTAIGIAFALCGPGAVFVINFVVFLAMCHESGAFNRFRWSPITRPPIILSHDVCR